MARTAAQAFYTFDYVNYRGQFDNLSFCSRSKVGNYKERTKPVLLNNVQKTTYCDGYLERWRNHYEENGINGDTHGLLRCHWCISLKQA